MKFYQLKVLRKNSPRPVWRRIAVPYHITFAQLALILDLLLEETQSPRYQFEFYMRARMAELLDDEQQFPADYYYSWLNAPDTFIDAWMEPGKAFRYRVNRLQSGAQEYRVEIEHDEVIITNAEDKECRNPVIMKQISLQGDTSWTDPDALNDQMEKLCRLRESKAEYLPFSTLQQNLKEGKGIRTCPKPVDREDHNRKSTRAALQDLIDLAERAVEQQNHLSGSASIQAEPAQTEASPAEPQPSMADRGPVKPSATAKNPVHPDIYSARPIDPVKWTMVKSLQAVEKDDLVYVAEEYHLPLRNPSGRKNQIVNELAQILLKQDTMKRLLLFVEEEELDAFEKVLAEGPLKLTGREKELAYPLWERCYLSELKGGMILAPVEVTAAYRTLKKNGYREYHKKAAWLMKCLKAAMILYRVFSPELLFSLYLRNPSVPREEADFHSLLNELPLEDAGLTLKNGEFVSDSLLPDEAIRAFKTSRRNVDFYIPSHKEILTFARDEYPSDEPAWQQLRQFFIRKMLASEDNASAYCRLIYIMLTVGRRLPNVVDMLQDSKDGPQLAFHSQAEVEKFAQLFIAANNEARLPELKGHKPTELCSPAPIPFPEPPSARQQPRLVGKKIGPNEPCPCGSGKKYKKCCGR